MITWPAQSGVNYEILIGESGDAWKQLAVDATDSSGDSIYAPAAITGDGTCKKDLTGATECSVPMADIKLITELDEYALIKIRVRATNEDCAGDWSDVNTDGARIPGCPAPMERVDIIFSDTTQTTITMDWDLPANKDCAATLTAAECTADKAANPENYYSATGGEDVAITGFTIRAVAMNDAYTRAAGEDKSNAADRNERDDAIVAGDEETVDVNG